MDLHCGNCGCDVDEEETRWVDSQDVCDECYDELTNECQLCRDRFEDRDTSRFILVKAELGSTDRRPPGIYWVASRPFLSVPMIGGGHLHGSDLVFVDKLPEFDQAYEISGHICKGCAKRKRYESKLRHVYGKRKLKSYDPDRWIKERKYTRRVILANPNMLRDLECDTTHKDENGRHLSYANANDWNDIKKLYSLPDLPTFHEWLFVEHKGVRVYKTSLSMHDPGWLSVSPEPRFRRGAGCLFPQTFSASSLPTYGPYDSRRSFYHGYDEAMRSVKHAIEQGFLKQDGCYSAAGVPTVCN
jgi:hypothetical protein